MPVTALPDLAGAINAYLRLSAAITALTSTRISTARQESWLLPTYAVLIQPGKGGTEEDGGLMTERVDIWCYGSNAMNANSLWRTLHYYLCPPVGARTNGFHAASTSVLKVQQEGGPLRLIDPDTDWPYTVGVYRFTYAVDPVS